MRGKRFLVVPWPLAALLLAAACGTPPGTAWETRTLERTAGPCDGPQAACGRVLVSYPVLVSGPSPEAAARIRDGIDAMLLTPTFSTERPASVEAMAERFLEEYRETRAALPEAASTARWRLEKRMTVPWHDRRALSVRLEETSVTGGAHPLTTVELASFALATGARLALDDLIRPGALPALDSAAEGAFREARGLAPDASLEAAGFTFPGGRFAVNDNVALAAEGLRFRFNPYEVAPYALGPTEIVVPWSALRTVVRTEWMPVAGG